MDCYFHNAVPSVATCRDCARTVCATCRGGDGSCPSCRLAARIDAATGTREPIRGNVGPSNPPPYGSPRPEPQPQPQAQATQQQTQTEDPAASQAGFWNAYAYSYAPPMCQEPIETRTLVALGYPFWPLALIAMLSPNRTGWAHRQALQALGFNFGCAGLGVGLDVLGHIPVLGWSAWPLLAFLPAIWLVGAVVFAIQAGHGDNARVPIVSEWLDQRDAQHAHRAA